MRTKLVEMVAVVLLASSAGGCPSTNTLDDAALAPDAARFDAGLDAAAGTDAREDAAIVATPDAFLFDAVAAADASRTRRDSGPRPDSAVDAGPTPSTITYVIDTYDLPDAPRGPRSDEAPGLDLDGRVSDGTSSSTCEDFQPDLVSPLGELGVDNQLVASLHGLLSGFIVDFDLQATLDEDIASGRRLLAIRLTELDSFVDDGAVRVELFLVKPEGCTRDVCAPPGGVVSPDALWIMGLVPIGGGLGEISGGRLHIVTDFPLDFEASGMTITITIQDAILEADVSPLGLDNGVVAGGLRVDDIVFLADTIMPGIGETARGILQDLADLDPSASDPLLCDEISAGLGMTAVPGRLE